MKRFNISVAKKYTKDGVEKTQWNTVGTLVHFPTNGEKEEGYKLELHMFPDTKLYVFEQKDETEKVPKPASTERTHGVKYPEPVVDDIDPNDIPF